MEFGSTINNPLLQVAVSSGEATIRHACAMSERLDIHVEMEQYADGRDAIEVTLRTEDGVRSFSMLLRKFFDRAALWRVARPTWQRRTTPERQPEWRLEFLPKACVATMN